MSTFVSRARFFLLAAAMGMATGGASAQDRAAGSTVLPAPSIDRPVYVSALADPVERATCIADSKRALRDRALRLQARDGGVLSEADRTLLQTKLDRINTSPRLLCY